MPLSNPTSTFRTPTNKILTVGSPEFSCGSIATVVAGGQANGAWPTANKAMVLPFRISQRMTVYQLGWSNGSGTMTDSVDIGIYSATFAKLVSGGGTARGTSGREQWVDVTDTLIVPGSYYLAIASNGTTSNNALYATAAVTTTFVGAMGGLDSADDLYPLPDPLTNMADPSVFTHIPVMMIATRVPF